MEKIKMFWLAVCLMLACAEASKILVVFPLPSRSHGNLGDGLVKHLLNAGHEVTYITPFPYKNAPPTLRTIDVSKNFDIMPMDIMSIKSIMDSPMFLHSIGFMLYMMIDLNRHTIQLEEVNKLLTDPKEEFDLVIAEWMFTDIPAGFASVFDCPLIWLSSVEVHWMILQLVDQPTNPAYTVDIMSTYTPPLNFWQRANELWTQVKINFLQYVLQELKKIMDNAKHGVVYFSMGSNLKSKDMPEELKKSLLQMFGTLKQTVLWKFEEKMDNLPSNVHILDWAPQQAILSHPNLAVFITHGGLLSTTESVHFGVPIIGIPVFADQFLNVVKAVNKGFAQRVDLSYTMADKLREAIIEVTSNKRYAEKAKELSFIHHDRPVKPGVELVHWVNHVINTRGAPHLRSPALHVPFYQKIYLDLAVFLVILLLVGRLLVKKAYRAVLSKSKAKTKTH
ncbi:UDP-glucuronosyltransferase 2B15-like [Spodoptera litura]|uniref:UDP-glucuronosyltransferase n=1 Tax=Spodoptera litura TaxID=69820 RepID=A0A9J7EW96_SPOLT|nr:UDP-glucuronosyltransferase 2B15-like [Spodoptera litura]